MESFVYIPPLSVVELRRPDARLGLHQPEGRKQIPTGEYVVKVLPTIGIERLECGVVIYDGDIVNVREWREAVKRFFPKPRVRLVELRADGQRLQRPFT